MIGAVLWTPLLDTLRADGAVMLPSLGHAKAREVLAYLSTTPIFDGHVKQRGLPATLESAQTCWSMEDVLAAPHVWDYALDLTDLVGDYLGVDPPLMYSVNAFTMYPHTGPTSRDTQEFHRDKDDVKFLALFILLTDVPELADGAHQYVLGTQTGATSGVTTSILGPAGTAFLADTRGFHRGIRPEREPRSMLWVRWGVSRPPPSYHWDKLQPCERRRLGDRYPTDPRLQRSVRLVVQ